MTDGNARRGLHASRLIGLAALALCCTIALGVARAGDPDWATILKPVDRASWPKPAAEVVWREDMAAALAEAKASGKPLFVTFRCLPCKQCMSMDQAVLDGGPTLDPLLKRFITVRLTMCTTSVKREMWCRGTWER